MGSFSHTQDYLWKEMKIGQKTYIGIARTILPSIFRTTLGNIPLIIKYVN